MAAASVKNLRMFLSICGLNVCELPSIILVTTMWDEVREEAGERRERVLKETFWKEMVARGCRTGRFDGTFETTWDIIGNLSERAQTPLQFRPLNETDPGVILLNELTKRLKDQKEATARLMKQAAKLNNPREAQRLDARRLEIELKIDQIADQLKIPFSRRLRLYLQGQSFR
jgi:hypothetical protein